jgi:glycosyltransferase involved in cell wall biosynthesis
MMKVALCHNHYQQAGGEDYVFRAEGALLEQAGHAVARVAVRNAEIDTMSRARVACGTVWNGTSYGMLRSVLQRERPDVVHFHNTFPLLSPAVWYAAAREGVPVVQTLHNFRLLCANSLLFRDGRACEACVGRRVPWRGVRHKCYRDSRAASAAVATMAAVHRAAGSYARRVAVFVALSESSRRIFVEGGLPADRIVVKPNFLMEDPGMGEHAGGFVLFVGRLSAEKGLRTLVEAWKRLGASIPLRIVGTGPLAPMLDEPMPGIEWLGGATPERVRELMRDATLLVLPSECYENCPITILEAFACGLPSVVSGHGALAEMVRQPEMGMHFRPGDAEHLVEVLGRALANPEALVEMGRAVRREFEARYSAEAHLPRLLAVYRRALEAR